MKIFRKQRFSSPSQRPCLRIITQLLKLPCTDAAFFLQYIFCYVKYVCHTPTSLRICTLLTISFYLDYTKHAYALAIYDLCKNRQLSFSNTRIFIDHIHRRFVNNIENLRISNESKILRFPYAAAWPRMAGYCMMPAAMALAVSSLWAS